MGINTLNEIGIAFAVEATGDLVDQYRTALTLDFLPRNISGIVTDSAGSLGTITYKWSDVISDQSQTDFLKLGFGSRQVGNPFALITKTLTGSGDSSGIEDAVLHTKDAATSYTSFDSQSLVGGSNNYAALTAFESNLATNTGYSGTLTDLFSLNSKPFNIAGTITNIKHININDVSGAGTTTNQYGIYISSLSGASNNWGIYSLSNVYIGASLGIGTNTPSTQMEIKETSGNLVLTLNNDSHGDNTIIAMSAENAGGANVTCDIKLDPDAVELNINRTFNVSSGQLKLLSQMTFTGGSSERYLTSSDNIGTGEGGLEVGGISGSERNLAMDGYILGKGGVMLTDGITAPGTYSGFATIYIDTSDGDLKIKFGDGTVKTIVTDT